MRPKSPNYTFTQKKKRRDVLILSYVEWLLYTIFNCTKGYLNLDCDNNGVLFAKSRGFTGKSDSEKPSKQKRSYTPNCKMIYLFRLNERAGSFLLKIILSKFNLYY